jgi:hypothetical protein
MTVTTDKDGLILSLFCGCGGVEYKSDFMVSSGSLSELVEFEVTKITET